MLPNLTYCRFPNVWQKAEGSLKFLITAKLSFQKLSNLERNVSNVFLKIDAHTKKPNFMYQIA